MNNQEITRIVRQRPDGSQQVIEIETVPDGSKVEKELPEVKLLSQYTEKHYYPSSRYEGRVYAVSRFNDGVTTRHYLRTFDEWPGSWDD